MILKKVKTQWDIDVNAFSVKLMTIFLERLNIYWTPLHPVSVLPFSPGACDSYMREHTENIACAAGKIATLERSFDVEEFESLSDVLPGSFDQFLDFFDNCVSSCFMRDYTPFNFIRYLRYVMAFSLHCHFKGHTLIFDYAAACISHVMLRYKYIFNNLTNCKKLVKEAERILSHKFQHPYMHNPFFHDASVMKQKWWNLSRK